MLPPEVLAAMGSPNQIALPGWFVRFVGVVEVLGALGLVLPGLLRIKPGLTPLAAAGLVVLMIGATAITVAADGVVAGVIPFVAGLLAAFIAYGRWRLAAHPARRETGRREARWRSQALIRSGRDDD